MTQADSSVYTQRRCKDTRRLPNVVQGAFPNLQSRWAYVGQFSRQMRTTKSVDELIREAATSQELRRELGPLNLVALGDRKSVV